MRSLLILLILLIATQAAAQQVPAPRPSVLFSQAALDTNRRAETGSRGGNALIMTFLGAGTGYLLVAGVDPDASAGATVVGIAAGTLVGHLVGGGSLRSPRDSTTAAHPDSISERPRIERVSRGAALGGAVGLVVGLGVGSYLARQPCGCDSPGYQIVLMPILGAVVGAVVGASAADEP